jgi:molecular chaperone HscB
MSAFALFGIAPGFALDTRELASRYRDLQSAVHPDRHATATDADQRAAMMRTVEINDAYTTLKDPVRRAMHLLALRGVDAMDEKNTSMPADFLMEQVEWREALADARLKEDSDRLDDMSGELTGMLRSLGDTFASAYAGGHDAVATTLARKMRFVQKLIDDVDMALAELE